MLFAVDTNPLIDWAQGHDATPDCLDVIRRRVPGAWVLVPPTVIQELGYFARTDTQGLARTALRTLELIRDEPLLRPVNLVPVGHGIVEINASKIRQKNLLPPEEINDSLILAEAGLLNCQILLSTDAHLTGIDSQRLAEVMRDFDGSTPIIRAPRQIIRQFGSRRR
jgi:predicted nucleic acid-binding protein